MTKTQTREHKSLTKSLRKETVPALRSFAATKLAEALQATSTFQAGLALAAARHTLASNPY